MPADGAIVRIGRSGNARAVTLTALADVVRGKMLVLDGKRVSKISGARFEASVESGPHAITME